VRSPLKSLLFALTCALSVHAWAGDVYVIASPGVDLSAGDLHDVFTGEKQVAGSVKLSPVDNASVQSDFLSKVIKVDAPKYASIWAKKGFREGINPPHVYGSDTEVITSVKSHPGTVGYVSKPPADVKVISKF
jgi:hypothetical protein